MRYSHPLRIAALVTLFFFSWSFAGLRDMAYAAKTSITKESPRQVKQITAAEKLSKTICKLRTLAGDESQLLSACPVEELTVTATELDSQIIELEKEFADTEKHLIKKGIAATKLALHQDFSHNYKKKLRRLQASLTKINKAKDDLARSTALAEARELLAKPAVKKIKHLDFDNLPNQVAKPTTRKPRLTVEDYIQTTQPLGADTAADDITNIQPTVPDETVAIVLEPPSAADLAATPEVQFTAAIQAKAAELNHNPVQIYNWVRNNIESVPTYGSIQGAEGCLNSGQGNPFDISSLLIALLRASGIHARYVQGTIEMGIDQAMNWAGDFTDAAAAVQFITSGGIPATSLVDGDRLVRLRMEHIWVEAWVDYIPSRGVKHVNGKGDSWIPMDASFKEYAYSQGIDLQAAVPFDGETFVNELVASATINETEGYVTGVDSLLIESEMAAYKDKVTAYIADQYPDATVGDVLGGKEINSKELPYLVDTLPYKKVVEGNRLAELPVDLRWSFSISLANTDPTNPQTNLTYNASMPELAGKKITLSYSPANPEDEELIASFLPEPHQDGTPIEVDELPDSLPAYLINLKPELRIDGNVVATGGAVTMGDLRHFQMAFTEPGQGTSYVNNTIEAGEYFGIGLDLGRISEKQLEGLKTNLESTKAKLEAADFNGLHKDDVLGELLHTTAISYFAELDARSYLTAKTMKVNHLRMPSATLFFYDLRVTVSGISGQALSASPGSLSMDADRIINVVGARNGNKQKQITYMHSVGMTSSSLEHEVPERLFSTETNKAEGISAVKALKLASQQNIPIVKVTASNIDTVLPMLEIDQQAKDNIVNAVNAGKEVTVSKTNIEFNGWNGCGYIIIDPETGAGAYMISGGLSGLILLLIVLLLILLWPVVFLGIAGLALSASYGSLAAALIGGFLAGFGIGTILSQLLSAPAKEALEGMVLDILQVFLGIAIVMESILFWPILILIAAIAGMDAWNNNFSFRWWQCRKIYS